MVQFAACFPDSAIVAALLRQLGWTHFTMLIPIDDPLRRDFYAEMCRTEGWSTRTLRKKLGSMVFERTALSRKPQLLDKAAAEEGTGTPTPQGGSACPRTAGGAQKLNVLMAIAAAGLRFAGRRAIISVVHSMLSRITTDQRPARPGATCETEPRSPRATRDAAA